MPKSKRVFRFLLSAALSCLLVFPSIQDAPAQSQSTPALKPSPLDQLDSTRMALSEKSLLPRDAVAVVPGSVGEIKSCAFSADGKLATGCADGTIGLWDLTGKVAKEITEVQAGTKTARVQQVALSADGRRLAAIVGRNLRFWDLDDSGAKSIPGPALDAHAVAFHPNGKLVVCGANNVGHLFEIGPDGLKAVRQTFEGASSGYTFTPDGAFFASIVFNQDRNGQRFGSEAMVWKMTGSKPSEHAYVQYKMTIKSLAISADGKWLATGALDERVQLWDLTAARPKVKATFIAPKWIRYLSFTADARHLIAVSSGSEILVWNVTTGEPDLELDFRPRGAFAAGTAARIISASALAPDGRHLAFSNSNTRAVILRLLSPSPRPQDTVADILEERRLDGHRGSVRRVAFLPDGKSALSCSLDDSSARQWNLANGKQLTEDNVGKVYDMALLPSGRQALLAQGGSGGGRITLWDYGKGRPIATWKGHELNVTQVRVLPNGKTAVTAGADGLAILWDLHSGKALREYVAWQQGKDDGLPPDAPRQASVVAIDVSPDAKFLATGASRNKKIAIWRLETGTQARVWPSGHGEVNSVAYSPNGGFLLSATNNDPQAGVQLWDPATGKLVREWLFGNTWHVCFSPDGKRFLATDSHGSIRLMDVDKQIPKRIFTGHEGRVNHVAFSPDGRTALSAGNDSTIRQWRIPD